MPGAYKYTKLVDLVTLIGSTKINVYGIVKDFTVVYKQGFLILINITLINIKEI